MNINHIFIVSNAYNAYNEDGDDTYVYEIGTCTTESVQTLINVDYENKSIVSLSELFAPYTSKQYSSGDDNFIPISDFEIRDESTYIGSGDSVINLMSDDYAECLNVGICATYGSGLPSKTRDMIYNTSVSGIRSIAFRNPIMVSGYGYTTEGLPTPSLHDEYTRDDPDYDPSYTDIEYNERHFAENVRDRADLWNAGPLDLRWDKNRKVYVAAPEIYIGYTVEKIKSSPGRFNVNASGIRDTFGSGEIEIYNGMYSDFCAPSGVKQKMLVINRSIEADIASGTMVIVTRANNGEIVPLYVDCDPDTKGQR